MIRIFEHATFISPDRLSSYKGDPISRNRTLIASRLPPEKFHFLAFSNDKKFMNHISLLPTNKLWPIRLYRFKPDIIHTRMMRSSLRTVKISRYANKKLKHLTSVHGFPEVWDKTPKDIKAYDQLIEDADIVHTVSKTTATEIKEKWGREAVVIFNGIDNDLFFPKTEKKESSDFNVLYVGRLVPHKHPEIMIELAKMFPSIKFTIVGHGSMYNRIISEIKGLLNIQLSHVPYGDIPRIYRNHDVFLFPSVHEGLSNAVLEAFSSGLPVICRNVSSLSEIIRKNYNGYFCDDIEMMGERIIELAEDPIKLAQMSVNARKSANKFDWKNIVKEYGQLFETLIQN